MRLYLLCITLLATFSGFAQDLDKDQLKAEKKAMDLVYKANEFANQDNYAEAEMEYRRAISKAPNKAVGAYNLANSYYKKGSFEEALFRGQEAAKHASTKDEKHRAYHNIGNILMQNKKCKEAVEAFKMALRNDPKDDETRYNYALAKDCADQQKDGGGEEDKKDDNKDQEEDKQDEQKKQDDTKKDEGDQDKKKGDKEEDEDGKPKNDKKDDGKGKDDQKNPDEKQKPKPGQMSPQQIKNILEAMQNQEQKVQEKMNAEKQKGAKVKTEKDW